MRRRAAPITLPAMLAPLLLAASASAEPSLDDYRYFRALSIDLSGRPPTRAELVAFEKPGFDVDAWIDARLEGPAYAERIRRIYMDLMRLQVGRSFQFVPPPTTLRRQQVLDEAGNEVLVYFRQGQRRKDPLTDGEFCFPKEVTGQTYPANASPVGDAKNVSPAMLDKYTVKVKPWWLYRDYQAKAPSKAYGESGFADAPGFVLAKGLQLEPDGMAKTTEVRVCKEEALTNDVAPVFTTGLTKKPAAIPAGRFTYPPLDSAYAQKNVGETLSCGTRTAFSNTADCGCGTGLERCMPGASSSFDPAAFSFATAAPLSDDTAFDQSEQPPSAWARYWWGQEAVQFIDHVVGDDRDFREMLTAPYTFVNGPLAQFYRTVAPATCCGNGTTFDYVEPVPLFDAKGLPADLLPHDVSVWKKVESRGPQASGLLTMPVFLTKYGSRRARAHVLYTTFLCKEFVAADLQLMPSEEPDLTKRPGCSACHASLEPLSSYFSRIVESDWTYLPEAQFPVHTDACKLDKNGKLSSSCSSYYDPAFSDATGATLRGAHVAPEHAAQGPAGIAAELTKSDAFGQCAVSNVASSFLGRQLGEDDAALRGALVEAFTKNGFKMKKLVVTLVKSQAYRDANNLSSAAWRAEAAP